MPANGISGNRGDVLIGVTQVAEVKKWTWNPKIDTKDYASNKTGGTKKRVKAVKDGSGTIDGVWDPWDPITDHFVEGDEVTLLLQHTTGQKWSIPAIIDSMSFEVDIESGDVETWTADFSANGVWTKPTALATTTTTTTTTAAFLPNFKDAGDLADFFRNADQPSAAAAAAAKSMPQAMPSPSPSAPPSFRGDLHDGEASPRPEPRPADPARQTDPSRHEFTQNQGPAGSPGLNPDAVRLIAAEVARLLRGQQA